MGPNVEGLEAGDHVALAVVNLPAGSTDVDMTGAEVFLQGGDGSTVVVGGELTVKRGADGPGDRDGPAPQGPRAGHDRAVGPDPLTRSGPWTGSRWKRDRRRTVDLDGSARATSRSVLTDASMTA